MLVGALEEKTGMDHLHLFVLVGMILGVARLPAEASSARVRTSRGDGTPCRGVLRPAASRVRRAVVVRLLNDRAVSLETCDFCRGLHRLPSRPGLWLVDSLEIPPPMCVRSSPMVGNRVSRVSA